MKRIGLVPLLTALLLLAAPAVWAGDGHNLHGIGAVNSAMGGAGVALPIDTLGGLLLNPALAVGMEGSHFAFSAEYNQAKNAVESTVTIPTPGGPLKISGRTDEAGDRALIPAFGFVHHTRGSNFAYGIGFLGLAGFGADYPQDSTNPILAPQPQGFGRVYSNYQLLKVPTVLSWQLSDAFSFGLSLNAAYATLTANPAGFATPDCSGPAGPCFVPSVNADSAWGYGIGAGIRYKLTPTWSLGASYNTKTKFQDFQWNSVVANPNLPTFGTARKIKLRLDMPAQAVVGLGWTPSDRLAIALDEKWINYEKTAGFEDILGFKDIKVSEIGLQYKATGIVSLRAGYNKSQNPIPADRTFFTIETPAIFRTHYTAGLGLKVSDIMNLDVAYYHVPENQITGPIFAPTGPVPGASVTTRMAMDSVVVTFNFALPQ
ncbi:MAG TPA: outer membrane protein transport protein [Thermoanaerobaculia bacterium]|nr:outer membrane protein transport protein [Thermoanaerobaculia bacterium]